jgi:hypothetical protein
MMKWLARGVFAALVAGAMLVAGPRYLMADFCDAPEQIGTCPPFNQNSCHEECILPIHGYPGGNCIGGCCTCII